MFLAMAWHAHRRLAADRSHRLISEHNARLLADQRRFLQDAAHQLRTPITIALGHAELLATAVDGQQEGEDIDVVIGELSRLRRISERLLIIAAAADPDFLHPEPVALDQLVAELIRRWRARRRPVLADRAWHRPRDRRPPTASGSAWRLTRCSRTPSGIPAATMSYSCLSSGTTQGCQPGSSSPIPAPASRRTRCGSSSTGSAPATTDSTGEPGWGFPWYARWPAPMEVT